MVTVHQAHTIKKKFQKIVKKIFFFLISYYWEKQKYYVKLHDFCLSMVEESVKFSRNFNVKKKPWQKIFRKIFICSDIKAAIFNSLEEIFEIWVQILKEQTRK